VVDQKKSSARYAPFVFCLLVSARFLSAQIPAGPIPQSPAPNTPPYTHPEPDLLDLLRSVGQHFSSVRQYQPISMEDPESIADLLDQHGDIRISKKQAISLALRNNLDIASARLLLPLAQTDIRRAAAGQLLREVPTSNNAGPSSAAGPLPTATASGFEGITSSQPGILSDLTVQLAGSPIPRLDPVFYATGSFAQDNLPQANSILTGTSFLESKTQQIQAGVQKGFLLGTFLDASVSSLRLSQNAPNNSINPAVTADVEVRLTQPLLQGFGRRVNSRVIHIAKINEKISDYTLRDQVTLTVTQVLQLYTDLVTFREQLRLSQASLDRSRLLLRDNKKRLDLGLISQDDFVESQVFVDAEEQMAEDAETEIEQQEAILKSVLTRRGLKQPTILAARIFPVDSFQLPVDDPETESVDSVANRAVTQRLEVARSGLQTEISKLSLLGTRDAVRPTLNVYADLKMNGLAGRYNPLGSANFPQPPPSFIGGYGQAFAQVGAATYLNYELGFQLNVPLTNAAARADNDRAEIAMQQQGMQTQQLENAIRLQAIKTALALRQAHRQYLASAKTRELRQKAFDTNQQMLDLGTATINQLISAQRQLDLAERQEVSAGNGYARALINYDSVLNETLSKNQIVIDEPSPSSAPTLTKAGDAR
jgi:outer membrane protein